MQRVLSRKQKGSKNRNRAKARLQRCHARIAYLRQNSLHQLTSDLTNRLKTIGIEDLNVSGVLKNSKLSRAIADMGLGEFKRQFLYKAEQKGCQVVVVDRFFPSSKMCSNSSCLKKTELTLSQRDWTCHHCGSDHDRDVNAAINLKNQAVSCTVTACGEESAGFSHVGKVKLASLKQEVGSHLSTMDRFG